MKAKWRLLVGNMVLWGIVMTWTPFVSIHANRIQAGISQTFPQTAIWLYGLFLLSSVIFIGITYLWPKKVGIASGVTAVLLLLVLLGVQQELRVLTEAGGVTQLRLSISFWLTILFTYVQIQLLCEQNGKWQFWSGLFILIACVSVFVMLDVSHLGLYQEYQLKADGYVQALREHITLALSVTGVVVVLGISLGYVSYRFPKSEPLVMTLINVLQVIPTIALLGLIMIPLTMLSQQFPSLKQFGIAGVGWFPAFLALICYGLLPMTVNTVSGLRAVSPSVLESAKGMGMTQQQIFRSVTFPLAVPVIFAGFRITLTQTIGNTILAGLIGGGGLGNLIFLGLAQSAPDLILLGAGSVVGVTLVANLLLKGGEYGYDYARKYFQTIRGTKCD